MHKHEQCSWYHFGMILPRMTKNWDSRKNDIAECHGGSVRFLGRLQDELWDGVLDSIFNTPNDGIFESGCCQNKQCC